MYVAIIDYKMSNLHSVQAACKYVGLDSIITSDRKKILDSKIAILPGVGSFGDAMNNIKSLGLDDTIKEFINTGKQFVGVCLGLQLLFDRSLEFGSHKGLSIIGGDVIKFNNEKLDSKVYKVPNVGWNKVWGNQEKWDGTLLDGLSEGDFMYFVHSFYVVPVDNSIILSTSKYGGHSYCSSIIYNNILATQFHPEKSGQKGLELYSNLLRENY